MTVSIAIATYNGDRFLREQLDSVYSQTHQPDEVVVSDDGSTDSTLSILEEYHQRYGLKYSCNTSTHGVNANFLRAISLCSGDVIQICDQDDIWLPNKTEVLYAKMCQLDGCVPVVISSLRYDMDVDGHRMISPCYPETSGWKATLLSYGRSQGCTMMINRKMADTILALYRQYPDEILSMYYDEAIAYTSVIVGEKYNLSDQLMYYRHHDKNVVDRYQGKLSFRDKVRLVPTFWGFTLDERLQPLHTIHQLFLGKIQEQDLDDFLTAIDCIVALSSPWKQLGTILHIPSLSYGHRIAIGVKSAISIGLKKCYHYPTI